MNKTKTETEDTKIEILYLNEEDMVKAGVMDASRCVDVMEETMSLLDKKDEILGGKNQDAHGLMLEFPKKSEIANFPLNDSRDRRFIAMPAYLGGRFHMAGLKWYGSNGRNREKGLPRSILMATLNDVETGAPLAYMSANLLSSMRTGSMPGLAAKLLANPDSKVLTVLGPGVINKASVMAILSKMTAIEEIRIKGSSKKSRTAISMKAFIEENYPKIKKVTIEESMETAICGSDIISEAVSCREGEWPKVKAEWLKPGATYICTSTFNMDYQSIIPFRKVVDNYGMFVNYAIEDEMGFDENGNRKHTGCMGEDFVYMVEDKLIDREDIQNIGEIINGKKDGRKNHDEIFLVSIEGIPLEDVAWGYECYERAKKEKIGTWLKLWDRPRAF